MKPLGVVWPLRESMFNKCRVELVFWYKNRLFSIRVILSRYASFSA